MSLSGTISSFGLSFSITLSSSPINLFPDNVCVVWCVFGLEIFLNSNFGISENNVKKLLIWDDSDMVGVFAEKSICVLIAGGGCGGKTQFEGIDCLKKFVGGGGGCSN